MKEQPVAKRPYFAPRLVVYGDLRTITESKRKSGSDGAVGADNKSV
jgi:hypothetical protein